MGGEPQREPARVPPRSPRITDVAWGRMEVEGLGAGRDFKLYPGAAGPGTGTRPRPTTRRASSPRTWPS